jgi:hypothetical protein
MFFLWEKFKCLIALVPNWHNFVALGEYFLASANIILFFILGTLWLDRQLRLSFDPMHIIEYFLWWKKAECAILMHYRRSCVWDEVLQNQRLNKYNHSAIDE